MLELFAQIIVPKKSEVESTNESMQYGTALEPLIRKMFAYDFPQYKMRSPKAFEMYRRIDKPYMTATMDGNLTEIKTKRKGGWECKTHQIRNREDEEEWNGRLPQKYYEQVIWYMAVRNDLDFFKVTAKLDFYDYFDPDGKKLLRSEIRHYHIERSEVSKDIIAIEKIATKFWEKNVLQGIIPDVKITF